MRFWYLSYRQPTKAQASLRIRAVSPEPLLFAHIKYGSRRRVQPKIRQLAPMDGCACAFEEWVYGVEKYHNLMSRLKLFLQDLSDLKETIDLLNLALTRNLARSIVIEGTTVEKWWITTIITGYRKIPKYSDTRKIAVIIPKFEQCGSTVE